MVFIPILVFTTLGMGHHWWWIDYTPFILPPFSMDLGFIVMILAFATYMRVDPITCVSSISRFVLPQSF